MHQPLYFFLLTTLKHSSYAVPVTLSVVTKTAVFGTDADTRNQFLLWTNRL